LKVRNYRIVSIGQLVKLVGVWMMFTAQDWLVLDLSGNSPSALGFVAALQFLPVLLLTLYSGRLADRYDKRKLLIGSNAAFAITAVVFAILVASGVVRLWHVFLFAGLLGIANAVETPVRQAFVSELVERPLLPNALSLSAAVFNCARIGGPALAGVALFVASRRVKTIKHKRVRLEGESGLELNGDAAKLASFGTVAAAFAFGLARGLSRRRRR